jgi:hypothetical protein
MLFCNGRTKPIKQVVLSFLLANNINYLQVNVYSSSYQLRLHHSNQRVINFIIITTTTICDPRQLHKVTGYGPEDWSLIPGETRIFLFVTTPTSASNQPPILSNPIQDIIP